MAAKQRKPVAKGKNKNSNKELIAIVLFALAIFFLSVIIIPGKNFWTDMHNFFLGVFGIPAVLYPVLTGFFAVALVANKEKKLMTKAVELSVLLYFISTLFSVIICKENARTTYGNQLLKAYERGIKFRGGGLFGAILGNPLCHQFGKIGAILTLLLLIFVTVMIITETNLLSFLRKVYTPIKASANREKVQKETVDAPSENTEKTNKKGRLHIFKGFNVDIPVDDDTAGPRISEQNSEELTERQSELAEKFNDVEDFDSAEVMDELNAESEQIETSEKTKKSKKSAEIIMDDFEGEMDLDNAIRHYKYPPFELLNSTNSSDVKALSKELDHTADKLVEVLKSFGVETRVLDISRGPTVTRYELQPCAGVKISKITGLADDIALNLAAAGVRIEAPIPNKAAVGIEVPNRTSATVGVREIIESSTFGASKSKLTVALGRDIGGNVVVGDIAKMPHGLIAGATGSGKSVCINSIIVSILYKATPDEVKLLMIDPKVVELGVYNGIPHLLVPVVTDPKKAAGALGWAVTEMEKRYAMFADRGVRDIEGYNRFVDTLKDEPDIKKLPHIVIIIDELADLMMTAPNEVEDSINRIAAKARAAGMHLLIATQRPSVDVVTGVIKANIPTRIAFAVSSQTDSRTILDYGGAEKLLGKGDMLFSPLGASKAKRIQGCFVSDKEVQKVVDFVKLSAKADYDDDIMYEIERQAAIEKSKKTGLPEDAPGDDPLLNDAILCVIEMGQASTSLLQRKLKLGYARAARIVDEMEARGVVGPYEGSKPRKVLITKDQFMEQQATSSDEE